MDRSTTQHAFKRVVADCGIHKHMSIHSLRHAYATHLIEAGLNLRAIQEQLGHANPTTTARYVRMTEKSRGDGAEIIDGMVATLAAALRRTRMEPRS
jgi:site-specific recombinase XerD